MAAKLLLPGYGGKYTSETFTDSSTSAADTIDLSRCSQFMVQIVKVSGTLAGSIIMENSLNGTLWASLGSSIDISTDGTISRFDITDGPFGLVRINPTGSTGTNSFNVVIVGFPAQPIN